MKWHCLRQSGLVVLSVLTALSCFSNAQTGCNLNWANNCSQQLGGPVPPMCPSSGSTCTLEITSNAQNTTVNLAQQNGGGSSFYCIDNSNGPVTVQWSEGTAMDTFVVAFSPTPFSNVMFSGGSGLPASGTIAWGQAGGCYEFLVVNCSSTQCAWVDPRVVVRGGVGGGKTAVPPQGGKGK